MEPLPLPSAMIVRPYVSNSKVAVIALSAVMVSVTGLVEPYRSPDQPVKVESRSEVAVSVMILP